MNIKFNHCKACSYPMIKPEDFGGNNEKNNWCKNCSYNDGTHKEFNILVDEMSNFLLTKDGEYTSGKKFNSLEEAEIFAKNYLKNQPAFKED